MACGSLVEARHLSETLLVRTPHFIYFPCVLVVGHGRDGKRKWTPTVPVTSGSAFRQQQHPRIAMMTALRRASGSDVGERVLKPSEIRALKNKRRGSSFNGAGNGAQGVLRQIAEMRAKLGGQTMTKKTESSEQALLDVCDEILKTEGNYLRDVKMTCDKFLVPLQPLVPGKLHGEVFANLQQLLGMHELLAGDLAPAAAASTREDKARKIAMAFKKFIPFLKMYANYSHSYASASERLADLKADHPKAKQLIEAAEGDAGPFLEALLFRPVQRMCVYPLLFKQAIKHVEAGSELHGQLSEVFSTIETTILQVNDNVRRQAELERTADILLSEVGGEVAELLNPSRTLQMEADVDMKQASGGGLLNPEWKIRRTYRWYLLTDVLLVCRPKALSLKSGGFAKKLIVNLSTLQMFSFDERGQRVNIDSADGEDGETSSSLPNRDALTKNQGASPTAMSFPVRSSITEPPIGKRRSGIAQNVRSMLGMGKQTSVTAIAGRQDDDQNDDDEDEALDEVDLDVTLERASAFHHGVHQADRTSSAPVKSRFGWARGNKKEDKGADRATGSDKAAEREPDKPEVLRFVVSEGKNEAEYKCWCASEHQRNELVAKLLSLQRAQRKYENALNRGGLTLS